MLAGLLTIGFCLSVFHRRIGRWYPPILITNGFQFEIRGEPGKVWNVETSTNSCAWGRVRTVLSQTGYLSFVDAGTDGSARKAYRVLVDGPALQVAAAYCARAGVVSTYGETPYGNTNIYSDGVHETSLGMQLLGSNCMGSVVTSSLGYENRTQAR